MLASTLFLVLLAACATATPILGVPPVAAPVERDDKTPSQQGKLVSTTSAPPVDQGTIPDDIIPLGDDKERSRFLVTLLMLESLRDKPGSAAETGVTGKLREQLLADEEVMQEVLQLYEAQQQENKGKNFIKIPPKLLKKIKKKMKELISE